MWHWQTISWILAIIFNDYVIIEILHTSSPTPAHCWGNLRFLSLPSQNFQFKGLHLWSYPSLNVEWLVLTQVFSQLSVSCSGCESLQPLVWYYSAVLPGEVHFFEGPSLASIPVPQLCCLMINLLVLTLWVLDTSCYPALLVGSSQISRVARYFVF